MNLQTLAARARPPRVHIEEWAAVNKYGFSELTPGCRLTGLVYGHPCFDDGEMVTTSVVLNFGLRSAATASRDYRLGKPAEGFRKWFLDTSGVDLGDDDG